MSTLKITKKDNSKIETASGLEFDFLYLDFNPRFPPRKYHFLADFLFFTKTDNDTALQDRIIGINNVDNNKFTYEPGTINNINYGTILALIKQRFIDNNPDFDVEEIV